MVCVFVRLHLCMVNFDGEGDDMLLLKPGSSNTSDAIPVRGNVYGTMYEISKGRKQEK